MSLRAKFSLALLSTSLVAVVLVGVIARELVLSRFNSLVMQQSFQQFRTDVRAYLVTYGSWEQARQAEPFVRFQMRRQSARQPGTAAPGATGGGEEADEAGNGPGPMGGPMRGPMGGPAGGPGGNAPFRFLVLNPEGRVLLGPPALQGRMAPPGLIAQAQPIVINGRMAVQAVPLGRANYSRQDQQYLDAVQQALWYGVAVAGVLAVGLGLLIGSRLSRRLSELTQAMQAMGAGALHQRVAVESNDEAGILAAAFNRMSAELSHAHDELRQSAEQIRQQAGQLKELSIRDDLTRLYNRRHFDEQVANTFAQADRYRQPLTVMIGDIDHFKRINDNFSHAVGDEVLRQVAQVLQTGIRGADIVARYGGEEFAIAFPQTRLRQAAAHCDGLRQRIADHPWQQTHPNLRVTMSMGLSDDLTLGGFEKMIAAADARLYYAKEHGRNRVYAGEVPPPAPPAPAPATPPSTDRPPLPARASG